MLLWHKYGVNQGMTGTWCASDLAALTALFQAVHTKTRISKEQ